MIWLTESHHDIHGTGIPLVGIGCMCLTIYCHVNIYCTDTEWLLRLYWDLSLLISETKTSDDYGKIIFKVQMSTILYTSHLFHISQFLFRCHKVMNLLLKIIKLLLIILSVVNFVLQFGIFFYYYQNIIIHFELVNS